MKNETKKRTEHLFKGVNSNLQITDPEWVDIVAEFSQSETVNANRRKDAV